MNASTRIILDGPRNKHDKQEKAMVFERAHRAHIGAVASRPCLSIMAVINVPLAQWIRASASGAEGRRFESCKGHQIGQPGLLHAARVFSLREPGPLTAVRDNRVSEDFRRGDAMVVPDAVFVRALHGAYNGTLVLRAYRARVWARFMC